MKKLILLIFISVLACAVISALIIIDSTKETPGKVAISYYKAIIEQDPNAVYNMLSKKDQQVFSIERLRQIFLMSDKPILISIGKEISGKIRYKILSEDKNEAGVKIDMEIQVPDLRSRLEDLFMILFSGRSETDIKNGLKKEINNIFANGDVSYSRVKKQFTLVKESGQWKISFENLQKKK